VWQFFGAGLKNCRMNEQAGHAEVIAESWSAFLNNIGEGL